MEPCSAETALEVASASQMPRSRMGARPGLRLCTGLWQREDVALSILTPIGKPPPLAVRLAQALPFRRAQGIEERRTLNVRPPAYGREFPDTYPGRDGLWNGGMARAMFLRLSNGSRGFAGPSGPFPASLAPSGGLHQTTRSAGST